MNNPSKPDTEKCKTCATIRNKIRCSCCKWKTEEWFAQANLFSQCILYDEVDLYRPKDKSKGED